MEITVGHKVLSMSTCFLSNSSVAVKVRKIGHSDKLAVDLLVFSPEVTYGPSDCSLKKIANNAAAPHGISSFDTSWLSDVVIDRKVALSDGSPAGIRIRKISLAYHGVA